MTSARSNARDFTLILKLAKENDMNIKNKTILITGANRGLGRAQSGYRPCL